MPKGPDTNLYHVKKALGYFLTWFVPSKKWRHIVRDIVYVEPELHPIQNLQRYMKCCRVARAGAAGDYNHYLAVCAIAKDEGPYFKEWIEYHRLVGVGKFYIYDNESTDDTKKILEPYIASGLVDYLYWPGQRQQVVAYNDCLRKHDTEARNPARMAG